MDAQIARGVVKGLTYKAGTKEADPDALGRVVIEFDAEDASAADIAALIGLTVAVDLRSPQLEMVGLRATKASITPETVDAAARLLGADA